MNGFFLRLIIYISDQKYILSGVDHGKVVRRGNVAFANKITISELF